MLLAPHHNLCINSKGHVTGTLAVPKGQESDEALSNKTADNKKRQSLLDYRVFLYDGNFVHDLGSFGKGSSVALALNDEDVIVGHTELLRSYRALPTAFIVNGRTTHIHVHDPLGRKSSAVSVNNHNQVLIQCQGSRSYIYRDDYLQLLNPNESEGWRVLANSINEKGQVVGGYVKPGQRAGGNAFIWDRGQFLALDENTIGAAQDINEAGQIVGTMRVGSSHKHAFLYESAFHDLGSLGFWNSKALAINNQGDIVGVAWYLGGGIQVSRALLWRKKVLIDLNELVTSTGWILKSALDINDKGQIVGFGEFHNTPQMFLLALK